ncbi:MAG: hydantoinase/oxoprolinase family protein, partial [bacterium]|nr:hydantoinase/oxoprolinase family protein [bacterium]
EELFTFSMPWKGAEILTLRLKASAPKAPFRLPKLEEGGDDPGAALKRSRMCWFQGAHVDAPVYDGERLLAGNAIAGPAIIEERTTTVVIPERYRCTVGDHRNYLLERH